MEKYILGEIFSSGGATLYKNPSDQTVSTYRRGGNCIDIDVEQMAGVVKNSTLKTQNDTLLDSVYFSTMRFLIHTKIVNFALLW